MISGNELKKLAGELNSHYLPNKVVVGTESSSELSLLKGREAKDDKTLVYICYNKSCRLPVETIAGAIEQLKH